jgi:hypothetical protein
VCKRQRKNRINAFPSFFSFLPSFFFIRKQGASNFFLFLHLLLLALPAKADKDIVVFRFIIEYSSLRDFGP